MVFIGKLSSATLFHQKIHTRIHHKILGGNIHQEKSFNHGEQSGLETSGEIEKQTTVEGGLEDLLPLPRHLAARVNGSVSISPNNRNKHLWNLENNNLQIFTQQKHVKDLTKLDYLGVESRFPPNKKKTCFFFFPRIFTPWHFLESNGVICSGSSFFRQLDDPKCGVSILLVQVHDNKTPQITKGQCLKSWAEFFWTKFNMKLPGILDWPLVNPKSFKHRRSQESRAEHTPPIKMYSKQNNPYYISPYHINYINKTYFTESTFNFQPWVLLIQTTQRNPFCAFPVASFKSFALGLIRNPRNRPLPVRGNLPWFPIQWRIFHHTTHLSRPQQMTTKHQTS